MTATEKLCRAAVRYVDTGGRETYLRLFRAVREYMNPEEPVAVVEKVTRKGKAWTIVVKCPFCDQSHEHGGGDDDDVVAGGSRTAPCGGGVYKLADLRRDP